MLVNSSILSDDVISGGKLFQKSMDWYTSEGWHLYLLVNSSILSDDVISGG